MKNTTTKKRVRYNKCMSLRCNRRARNGRHTIVFCAVLLISCHPSLAFVPFCPKSALNARVRNASAGERLHIPFNSLKKGSLKEEEDGIYYPKMDKDDNDVVGDNKKEKEISMQSFRNTFWSSFPELEFWKVAEGDEGRLRKRDLMRSIIRRLTNLSLEDYRWRSDFFKKTEADRRVEESLARMMGEDAAYIRPMDAGDDKIGPLGRLERTLVNWLSLVIEEEGKRARLMTSSGGDIVRPMDLGGTTGEGGPLSEMEQKAVEFLESIRASETERVKARKLRPKDMNVDTRGPLGDAEAKAVSALQELTNSENLRMEQTKRRGGEIVRPIDIPGPLGEIERWYVEVATAERQRSKETKLINEQTNTKFISNKDDNTNGDDVDVRNYGNDEDDDLVAMAIAPPTIIRPKDASIKGPLGDAETKVSEAVATLQREETERLKSMKKVLQQNRPMDKDRESLLGYVEAFLVGLIRAPQLLKSVTERVRELLDSSIIDSFQQQKQMNVTTDDEVDSSNLPLT